MYLSPKDLYRVETRFIRLDPGVGSWRRPVSRWARLLKRLLGVL